MRRDTPHLGFEPLTVREKCLCWGAGAAAALPLFLAAGFP